jgi:hypothetical protein
MQFSSVLTFSRPRTYPVLVLLPPHPAYLARKRHPGRDPAKKGCGTRVVSTATEASDVDLGRGEKNGSSELGRSR